VSRSSTRSWWRPRSAPGASPSTPRKTEVLSAAERGVSTDDIGEVGARNRIEAVRIVRDAGWM
jgi:DNA-binding NarL/FixJ family response regulator